MDETIVDSDLPESMDEWACHRVHAGAGIGAGKSRSQNLLSNHPHGSHAPSLSRSREGHLASYYTTLVAPSCVCVQHQPITD